MTLLIGLVLWLHAAAGDTLRVQGYVGDAASRKPLVGASVRVADSPWGVATDSSGRFVLHLPRLAHQLEIRFLGYATTSRPIELRADTTLGWIWLQPERFESPSVEVRADRAAGTLQSGTLQHLDAGQLERQRGQTLGETLSSMPGVDVLQTGPAIAKPVIRGLHSDRVVTLQSGVTQEGQQWGGEHAPEIDPFSPGRIEVVKGAAGVEYGIGAIGGVVRVIPRDIDPLRRFSGEVLLNGYSNNGQGAASVNLEGSPVAAVGWRLQGSLRRSGDARTPDYVIDNSGFAERSLNATLVYRTPSWQSRLYLSHFGTDLGIYTGAHIGSPSDLQRAIDRGRPAVEQGFTYKIGNPKQQISHHLLAWETSLVDGKRGVFSLNYGLQQNHRQEFDAHGRFGREITEPAFDLTLTTQTLDLNYQHTAIHGFDGKFGLSLKRQGNVRRSTGFLIPDFRAYSGGVFWLERKPMGAFVLEAGTRFDFQWVRVYSVRSPAIEGRLDHWWRPTATVGAIWNPAPAFTARLNFGTAWRPPGVNERFSHGVHHGTAQYESGDPNLKPERSANLEAGLSYHGTVFSVEATIYANLIRDFIQLRPDGTIASTIRGAFPRYQYGQNDARIVGSEIQAVLRPLPWLTIEAAASALLGENTELGEPLYMMPAPQGRLTGVVGLPDGARWEPQFHVGLRAVARQARYPALVATEAYREPSPPPAYALVDIGYSQRLQVGGGDVRLSMDVNNLFDVRYRDYLSRFRFLIDEPGRNFILRISIPFGIH